MYGARRETRLTGANITKFHIVKLYTFHSIYKVQIIMSYSIYKVQIIMSYTWN